MTKILDNISGPADLKALSRAEIGELARELREEIVDTVIRNGGHLASSLGAVELTLALHRVFDSPKDKIIWDVGHQSYAHKLLTGRRGSFATLRQMGGLSGFTSRDESLHDPFGAGHAGTSISAALGIAKARDLAGSDFHVVAVIGDGAIGNGMAFEAVNHAGQLGSRLIVILNDNGMSISPTVGSLSRLLSRIRSDERYRRANEQGKKFLKLLPKGDMLRRQWQRFERSVKGVVLPTVLWEELGFTYMGPFDGHDIEELESALKRAKRYSRGPVLMHVLTTKGKGFEPAEENATYFHGVSPSPGMGFKALSYSEVFARTIQRLMRERPDLVVITAAMPDGNCLREVQEEFPERVFDVGICEEHAVTFAAGLATQGFIPVVAIYSTFLQRGFDQIIHDVCLQKLPVVFALDRAGIVGEDGKTHQGAFDLSYLCLIPNLVVAAPADENELQHLLYTAVSLGRPMAVRYPRGSGTGAALDDTWHRIPIGQGEVLRTGQDIALIAIGSMVWPAMKAAEALEGFGFEAAVVNARFAKPLDERLIVNLASTTGAMVTLEENTLRGGFASAVSHLLWRSAQDRLRFSSIGLPDKFIEHGSQSALRSKYGLDTNGIVQGALALLLEGREDKFLGTGRVSEANL